MRLTVAMVIKALARPKDVRQSAQVLGCIGKKIFCGVCAPHFFAPQLMIEVSALCHFFDVCHFGNVPLSCVSLVAYLSALGAS
jgi:hypothetical protein